MNKQSAFINEESHEKIVKENEEEKHKDLKKELKRKRNCEYQRAYYYRQKILKKNEKKNKKIAPKTNAERQREFRQRKAGKSYVDIKRRILCSNEENVVQGRAVENIENVTLQENQFHSQQLHIYEQRNECITPEVILHRNSGIPGDVFKMGKTNAEYCKDYYNRTKAARKAERIRRNLLVNKPKRQTGAERTRNYRLRKLMLSQIESSVTEISSNPSTSNSQIRSIIFGPSFQLATTSASTSRPDISTVSSTSVADHDGAKETIHNEMEDVKVQVDGQTNEKIVKTNTEICNEIVRNQKSNELDKFKRRMIRAIARLLYTENKPETDIWKDLKTETGCDCELLWSRMRALTIKKLFRLFTAEDKINNITKIVQLSVTDWLLYDLVLVHEKVDVIGQELDDKEEPAFLRDLFDVVEEFNIEYASEEELCEKWFEATAKYNNTGKRQCSPMLLQKRWYQLKERSRSNFYNFWFQYRGDSRKLERANEYKPSDLQLDIVKRYREIVTKPFLNWEVLVKERRVALPADFERLRLARKKISISENEPDLEVIEQQIETIDLEETNDSNDSVNKNTDNNEDVNDFNIDIVKIESLAEPDDDVSVLESVHIPLEKFESSEVDVETIKSPDDNDLEIIESDPEQIMPKIASVTSTACLESAKNEPEKLSPKQFIDLEHYDTQAKSIEAVNTILDQIVKEVVENKRITNLDEKNATTSKEKVLKLDKDMEEFSSNLPIDLDKDEIQKNNIQDNVKTSTNSRENYELNSNIDFDDFSNNFNFIDEGIEFEDDGIEYMDEDYVQMHKVKPEIKSEIIEETNEEEPKIDLKLLLTPVVYTKKLDDMDVFRFIDYNTVKDDRVLQNAARESKPEDAKSFDMKKMFQECNHDESGNVEFDDGDIIPEYDIAISSWLFRKPKVDNYNPIQLCKNPDFNTRLKRLAAAFYTSERNRLLLKQCKPLTVDLHKTFESQLINNTLYLKTIKKDLDIDITSNEMIATSYKTESPDIMEPSTQNIAAEQQISIAPEQTSEIHTERNKVINLPDIEQIRRVNQGLLVAEVSPIQVSNPVNQSSIKPQNNLSITVVEAETPHMSSSATDEDIIKSPSNASQFSLGTDKVIAVSESDDSKPTEAINVDNEQSETLSSKYTSLHKPTNYKRHNINSLFKQPLPKHRTKTGTKKYMELSWRPKPQPSRTDASDCLLAADTVERILSLCKDDYISPDPKVLKPKRKGRAGVLNKNTTQNQIPTVRKTNTIKEKKIEKKKRTSKKNKCHISITTQTTNIKNVCCWSRQKIENFYKLNTGKHFCLHNRCVCCCKADLEAKLLAMEQQRKRCDPIILSDDESTANTAGKNHHPISKITIGTNTDYDKDFEDQFAANLNAFKDNSNQVFTPIISLPLSDLRQTESGCQTQTPNIINKALPPTTLDHKITAVTSTHKNKPKVPISLGKNKILLCSFKPTIAKASNKKLKKCNQNSQSEQVLPDGCQLVLLPNRELALSIDPGVELDANELNKLPSLIAAVQKQINIIPTSENNLDPNKVTLNEETVIHLSDDENPNIKDNDKNNLNINDSSTSKSSPTAIAVCLDSINANTVSDVAAITKEDNQIPNSDPNNLSSPKESYLEEALVTTNNSTIKNDEVILESTNEINSKDNTSGEVIDNSTNNTEDASGVNKKTILSDLMEMSGISTDDIIVNNNDENVTSNDISVSNIGSGATNNESISIIHPVLSQEDSFTSDLQREYVNITRSVGIDSITNNIIIRAALLRCPELNVVSSFPELKYAYENGAQFFKMDVVNRIIVPINICIKQDLEEVRMLRRKGISKVSKSVIDLTDDIEIPSNSSNIRPIQQKITTQPPNEICDEIAQDIQPDKNNSAIKPIKMFKAVHPSILRYSGRSLLVRPINNSTVMQNKIIGVTKHKRKQGLYVKNLDLDEDNKLKTQNNPSNRIDSDAESDEEPLAKKAKRLKDNLESENKDNDPSLDVDSDMNGKGSATIDKNNEIPPRLPPFVFEDNTDQSSDDDCILGV